MIRFSDLTIIESLGVFQRVKDIMGVPHWMIESTASVITDDAANSFVLHFWDSADVHINKTDLALSISASDSALRELKQWCDEGSWRLCLDDKFLLDVSAFQFWLQKYREGIVFSHQLERYDKEEMVRMNAALESERTEEIGEIHGH